jgi:GH15 family glucan-1,4-alpha-glucosidase
VGRPVILSNGSLMVGLNEHGLVHDFYYPYIGLDNLTNARSLHHKIGVWVDGEFHWMDDGSWETTVNFEENALVSSILCRHSALGVQLQFTDFVDSELNVLGRIIKVSNSTERDRDVRVFMHQVFQISRAGRADTALFVPDEPYILDFKGNCSLLIYGQTATGSPFDQFATGIYGIESKAGTYMDAEDGELSGNPVEHGGVDTVIRMAATLQPHAEHELQYWVIAADSQFAAQKYHDTVLREGLQARLRKTREFWHDWHAVSQKKVDQIEDRFKPFVRKSLMVIKAHADRRGGIVASGDSSIYNYGRDYYSYVWPRDAALALWPLVRLGYSKEAKRYFEFCRDVLHPDGYLQHKFQPDRSIGSTWHPLIHNNRKELAIQEDETAIVLFMLGEYYDYIGDADFVSSLYKTLIKPAADFMAGFIDKQTGLPHASYDLWEEKFLTNTYTVAVTHAALTTAARLAQIFNYPDDIVVWRDAADTIKSHASALYREDLQAFCKGYWLDGDETPHYDDTLDISSAFGAFMFGETCFEQTQVNAAFETSKKRLLNQSVAGGVIRYEHDAYFLRDKKFKGNPWFVCSLWMAQYALQSNDRPLADSLLDWTMSHALPSGVLSEQIDPETNEIVSVAPLVWSHAEFINTVLDYTQGTLPHHQPPKQ